MHTTFPPELVEILSPVQAAILTGWYELPGLFFGIYMSEIDQREPTYWISFASTVEGLKHAKRVFIGTDHGFSRLDYEDPLFILANNEQAELEAVREAILRVNPLWHSRAMEIIRAASIVFANEVYPALLEEYEMEIERLDKLGVINRRSN